MLCKGEGSQGARGAYLVFLPSFRKINFLPPLHSRYLNGRSPQYRLSHASYSLRVQLSGHRETSVPLFQQFKFRYFRPVVRLTFFASSRFLAFSPSTVTLYCRCKPPLKSDFGADLSLVCR